MSHLDNELDVLDIDYDKDIKEFDFFEGDDFGDNIDGDVGLNVDDLGVEHEGGTNNGGNDNANSVDTDSEDEIVRRPRKRSRGSGLDFEENHIKQVKLELDQAKTEVSEENRLEENRLDSKLENKSPNSALEPSSTSDLNLIDSNSYDASVHQPQTHSIIIPSYASWFNMKKIHKIEKQSLPEFFKLNLQSKSPKIYLNYRNFMINSYRLNPNEFLTLTSIRRNLVGDVGTLMRVHRFLNKWGLINYQVKPQFKPGYSIEKLPNGDSGSLPYTGDYNLKYDNPRGLFPFELYKLSENINLSKLESLLKDNEIEITNFTNDNKSIQNNDIKNNSNTSNNNNNNNTEKRQLEESFDSVFSKKQNSWTEDQLDKLISATSQHKNDWYQIAEIVGKTPQECILQFLQIPIEDEFNIANKDDKILQLLRYSSNFPLKGVDNPVLSTLAFVSQLIDSDVAKAASQRASKVMDNVIEDAVKTSEVDRKKKQEDKTKLEAKKADNEKDKTGEEKQIKDDESEKGDENEEKQKEGKKDADLEDDEETVSEDINDKDVDMIDSDKSTKVQTNETQEINGKSSGPDSTGDVTKDAVISSLGIIGARSHLFATYEEREMNNLTATLVNHELSKIDLKLSKVDELEKIYERERRNLIKQQEEVFLDRLSLVKSTIGITKKLNDAISLIENFAKSESNVTAISELLGEAKSLLIKPTEHRLTQINSSAETSITPTDTTGDVEPQIEKEDESLKPLSIKQPQAFQVWAP